MPDPTVKDLVELAASSPDQRIRAAAGRVVELQHELQRLNDFLALYFDMNAKAAETPRQDRPGGKARTAAAPPAPGKAGKTARMVAAACELTTAAGKPLSLDELYRRLGGSHPELCPNSAASLRARLTENKASIARVDGGGYWPVGKDTTTHAAA